jgi:hypothetical protein
VKVFNLTNKHIDYRGKTMGPYGMSDHPDLKHVPTRDLAMAEAGTLAFGSLPKGWKKPEPTPEPTPAEKAAVGKKKVEPAKKAIDVVKLEETAKVEVKVPPEAKPDKEEKKSKK